ncbi:MAG: phage major capsid protein [Acidobacteria bacterium]|nr:phage major capsid protein [Acidobacteriota bacterium]
MASIGEILERFKTEPPRQSLAVYRRGVDEKNRIVSLAFASDKPVDHWFGRLQLSMNRKAMRSDRLKLGAPLLMDHNPSDQIGVVESFTLGNDGMARADVRFGDSQRAEEIFRDVKNGIRRNVSVGFMVHEMHREKTEKGQPDLYRSDDWEPFEISIVSIPADISVGVGRSLLEKTKMDEFDEINPNDPNEIIAFAEIYGEANLAREMLLANSATNREAVRVAILAKRKAAASTQPQVFPMDPWTAAERQGGQRIEFARSIPRYGKLRAFKGEGAEERAYRFGQWILGGPLGNNASRNWCQQNGLMITRAAQVEGINEKGGYTVPEEFGNDIVQLMEQYGIFRQNAHIVPMSSDRRTDPVLNGELTSAFVGEMAEGTDQDLDFGMIGYTAKKQMVLVPYSSEVSEDSAISIGDHLADAAGRAFAYKEDICGFNGDGTSTYGGMVGLREALKGIDASPANIAGLQVGSGNAYSELALVDFEGVVGRLPDYADTGNAKWYVSRRFYYNVMVKLLLAASGTTPTEIEDARNRRYLGYPVVFTRVMPTSEANSQVCALFGDLGLGARLADRRKFTTAIDDSILFRKDALLFRATARFDVNCSFGVGDTTNAGPVCGLITAAS